jgi:hypothetical protein
MIDSAAHSKFHSGAPGLAYNESAFRHFLSVDRSRARQSRRFVYLVLVAVRDGIGRRARLSDATAAALFRGLGSSVREIDFVGWFHEGYVAAAVLFQGGTATGGEPVAIAERVRTAVARRLSLHHSDRLRVRVVRLSSGTAG